MRWLAVLAAMATVGSQAALAAPQVVPTQLVGTWTKGFYTLTIKANGRATFDLQVEVIPETISGTRTMATFGPAGVCFGKGMYSWKRTGRTLTLKPVKDACGVRRTFVRGTWTRK